MSNNIIHFRRRYNLLHVGHQNGNKFLKKGTFVKKLSLFQKQKRTLTESKKSHGARKPHMHTLFNHNIPTGIAKTKNNGPIAPTEGIPIDIVNTKHKKNVVKMVKSILG